MLSRYEIVDLAKRRGVPPWQEEKRYVQTLALYSLRDQPLVLKGGTYLWLFHGLDRFSDDLDFTESGRFDEDLRTVVKERTILFGLPCESKPIKSDRYTVSFRVDSRGPLYTSGGDICRIYVEVSRRDKVKLPVLSVKLDEPEYGLPLIFLRGMDLSEILAEKVRALIRRRKARDLYDLWYLIHRKKLPFNKKLVDVKLSFYGKYFDVASLDEAIKLTEKEWSKELKTIVVGEVPSHEEVRDDILKVFSGPTR